ncbi:F0F1 ATP synthase subunit B [Novipirellula artificiosorum]|uniref:ATP synthase subunit b n=1 Tax=Novipirellula artificiosorum TaxID=2528016 RepID=A0A5C6D7U5_9BACT|nr:F0F1 ATP synthase subunit B [Novipirellula artificiosorum]TWU30959.1 ATP synthase subunit b precursor [Novipirellula artificiosorum]
MLLKLVRLSIPCLVAVTFGGISSTVCFAEAADAVHQNAAVDGEGQAIEHEDAHTPPILQFDVGSAVVNIGIFLGVLAILSKFVWPPVLNGLKAREDKIHSDLANAERINTEARTMLDQYQTKLDEASGQVQAMLAEARQDAEANSQRILAEAKAEADRNRERAVADIDTAKKVALTELAGQTSNIAMQVAKQVVGRELRPEDHADLVRQSLDRLPSNN